jgi:hypothetical protein
MRKRSGNAPADRTVDKSGSVNHPGGVIHAARRVDTVPFGIRTPPDC